MLGTGFKFTYRRRHGYRCFKLPLYHPSFIRCLIFLFTLVTVSFYFTVLIFYIAQATTYRLLSVVTTTRLRVVSLTYISLFFLITYCLLQ
jgi:hypothetical protein